MPGCPSQPSPKCEGVKEWVREQRESGNCKPFQPNTFKCLVDRSPTFRAHIQWKIGRRCADYFMDSTCIVRNRPMVEVPNCNLHNGAAALSIQDCEKLAEEVSNVDKSCPSSSNCVDNVLLLAGAIETLRRIAHKYWVLLPPSTEAVERLANGIREYTLGDAASRFSRSWSAILFYCVAIRELNQEYSKSESDLQRFSREELDKHSEDECNEHVGLNKLAAVHPLWRAALNNFLGVETLQHFWRFGLETFLDEQNWLQLAASAGGDGEESYARLRQCVHDLIVSAGDRSEHELSLALQLTGTKIADGAVPIGGVDRLREMKIDRHLQNALVYSTDSSLNEAIHEATQYLEATSNCLYWVDVDAFVAKLHRAQEILRHPLADNSVTRCGPSSTLALMTTTTTTALTTTTTVMPTIASTVTTITTSATTITSTILLPTTTTTTVLTTTTAIISDIATSTFLLPTTTTTIALITTTAIISDIATSTSHTTTNVANAVANATTTTATANIGLLVSTTASATGTAASGFEQGNEDVNHSGAFYGMCIGVLVFLSLVSALCLFRGNWPRRPLQQKGGRRSTASEESRESITELVDVRDAEVRGRLVRLSENSVLSTATPSVTGEVPARWRGSTSWQTTNSSEPKASSTLAPPGTGEVAARERGSTSWQTLEGSEHSVLSVVTPASMDERAARGRGSAWQTTEGDHLSFFSSRERGVTLQAEEMIGEDDLRIAEPVNVTDLPAPTQTSEEDAVNTVFHFRPDLSEVGAETEEEEQMETVQQRIARLEKNLARSKS